MWWQLVVAPFHLIKALIRCEESGSMCQGGVLYHLRQNRRWIDFFVHVSLIQSAKNNTWETCSNLELNSKLNARDGKGRRFLGLFLNTIITILRREELSVKEDGLRCRRWLSQIVVSTLPPSVPTSQRGSCRINKTTVSLLTWHRLQDRAAHTQGAAYKHPS